MEAAIQIVVSPVTRERTTFDDIVMMMSQSTVQQSTKQISLGQESRGHHGPHVHLHTSDGLTKNYFLEIFIEKSPHLGHRGRGDRLEVEQEGDQGRDQAQHLKCKYLSAKHNINIIKFLVTEMNNYTKKHLKPPQQSNVYI